MNHRLERVGGIHGPFKDDDLADILQKATLAPAAAFKARGSPEWMRVIEMLSIEQSRKWGTCTVGYAN
jgi:linoleate 10R-lipoxygenase